MPGIASIINGYVTPRTTNKAVVPEDLYKLVAQMAFGDVMFFTSIADRTAKLATLVTLGLGAPPAGAVCYLSTLKRHEWFDGTNWLPFPGAIIARHRRTTDSPVANPAIVGVVRLDNMAMVSGYAYEIKVDPMSITSNTGDVFEITLRANAAGVAGTGSTAIQTIQDVIDNVGAYNSAGISVVYVPAVNETLSVLLCLLRTSGGGSMQIDATATRPLDFTVTFQGRDPGSTGVDI